MKNPKIFKNVVQNHGRAFWGRHLWARGYFATSSGNVDNEVIMKYIEQQGKEPQNRDFNLDD